MGSREPISPATVLTEAVRSGPVTVTTVGDSMLPHLEGGHRVRVEQGRIGFGHIAAVVNAQDRVVVHRHVFSIGGQVLLLGDNNSRFDPLLATERVLGRVVSVDDGPEPSRQRAFLSSRIVRVLPREARAWMRRRRG